MKIVFLTTVLPVQKANGGEIATLGFVTALRNAGHRVILLGYARPGTAAEPGLDQRSVAKRYIETERAGAHPLLWMLNAIRKSIPYSVSKYQGKEYVTLLKWSLDQDHFDLAIVDHAQVGFLIDYLPDDLPMIFIAHNVENRLYGDQANFSTGIKRFVLARESRLMERFEERLAQRAREIWTLTDADRLYFDRPGSKSKAFGIPSSFETDAESVAPVSTDICLLGSWTWDANAAGLRWFFDEVFPLLPNTVNIEVAGSGASWLEKRWANVLYRGFVPDANRFLGCCKVVAIPSIAGGGVQIKTLDSIASGQRIVATPVAMRGIESFPKTVRVAGSASEFARELISSCTSGIDSQMRADAIAWSNARRRHFEFQVAEALSGKTDSTIKYATG